MNKKQFIIIGIVGALFFSGCASVVENIPGFKHAGALVIGDTENNVVQQAEHILVSPKQEVYAHKDTPEEIKIRRYTFTNVYDLVLYFHKGIFFQASLMEPNSTTYPFFRPDFRENEETSDKRGFGDLR